MKKKIAIVGALDTKGLEFEFLKKEIELRGPSTLLIDTGVLGEPYIEPDISRGRVAQAGGKKPDKLPEALSAVPEILERELSVEAKRQL